MDGGLWSSATSTRRKKDANADANPLFDAAAISTDLGGVVTIPQKSRVDEEPIDTTGLPDVIEMDQHARVELIERMTNEGMALMEAGNIDEAQEKFSKMNRIVALFERLTRPEEDPNNPKKRWRTDREVMGTRPEEHVLATLRREMHREDFVQVFGGKAKWAGIIGAW